MLRELPWMAISIQLILAWIVAVVIHHFLTPVLQRLAAPLPFSRRLLQYGHRAGRAVVFLLLAQVILRNAPDTLAGVEAVRHVGALALISAMTWLGVRCVRAVMHVIIELHPADTPNNLEARRIQTQTRVLGRTIIVVVILIGSGAALMTLPLLRQIGTSLLASAGFAGLVVGFAAKPVLGNLLAGMQIALTQPIRLDDVVIVQNEWGQIEEITGTYVVVRIWDQRRLIVPLQWFIENPFQNWTRTNADILGTVLIWVDYRMPVALLREEAERLCRDAPEWDGRLVQTQVVESSERAMQVRILVSAGDAGRAWDLRCRIREGLVDFVQRRHPEYLPHLRTSSWKDDGDEQLPAGIDKRQ
ncbi:mechanosensitive ion channel [Noviherbaspirillum sp. 17J57-3]|uniref:Mechanosensitive ion channel n=2 Tax=Noviherbaspirillum galbum TaxID=2709383 RepID=A0A6B3SHG0_9BURK|nr:mechanosensitive ion channel [Noviherbaspirillum galbum]